MNEPGLISYQNHLAELRQVLDLTNIHTGEFSAWRFPRDAQFSAVIELTVKPGLVYLCATEWGVFPSAEAFVLMVALREGRYCVSDPFDDYPGEWVDTHTTYGQAMVAAYCSQVFDFFYLCPETRHAYFFSHDEYMMALNAESATYWPWDKDWNKDVEWTLANVF